MLCQGGGGWVEGKFRHKYLPGAVTQLSGGARLTAAPLLQNNERCMQIAEA